MDLNEIPAPTISEIRAYEQLARELRSEAAGELGQKIAAGVARLFHNLTGTTSHAAHA